MDLLSGEFSAMVFKRVVRDDLGNFSLDARMLAVFMELDGKTPIGEVGRRAGLNMSTMREVIPKLLQLKLVAKVEKKGSTLDKDFLDYLFAELSLAVGPIAEVLIEDEIKALGFQLSRFPAHHIAELVNSLARSIRREEKKAVFKKNMINKIREKGYF